MPALIDVDRLVDVVAGTARVAGTRLGLQLGVAVTEGLRYVASYRAHVPGMPAAFEKRHLPVVGPMLAKVVPYLPAGRIRDFGAGLAAGATEAPGWTYFIGR